MQGMMSDPEFAGISSRMTTLLDARKKKKLLAKDAQEKLRSLRAQKAQTASRFRNMIHKARHLEDEADDYMNELQHGEDFAPTQVSRTLLIRM
jgi:hypothetical protein